jgi:hypothetical protein
MEDVRRPNCVQRILLERVREYDETLSPVIEEIVPVFEDNQNNHDSYTV